MATYAITVNDLRSKEDKLAGRIEKFASSEEMFQSLGI